MSMTVDEAGRIFTSPAAYADESYFHEACTLLRREDPVHWVDVEGFRPFWALTKHADVFEIETRHEIFLNAPRPILGPEEGDIRRDEQGDLLRTLIHMDEPDHRFYRGLASDWFLPKNLKKLEPRLQELARRSVDQMQELGGECDFFQDVAMHYPLQVILSILGLPESDYPRMLKLTQEMFGSADPDLQRGQDMDDLIAVITDFFAYFTALTAERRANPTDDLASVLANATKDGEYLGDMELISYYVIAATAGHDTTSSAIGGGMRALLEHPDQLERLKADRSLMSTAVDEMIRWVTPVKQFMRTATVDHDLRGTRIEAGQAVLLSYPSANRDEEVFGDPFTFDVGRFPNKHLAFGFGIHYCLGAMLARMEMKALYEELLPRLEWIELAGEPAMMQTLFVGGPKRVPIRYEVRPAA